MTDLFRAWVNTANRISQTELSLRVRRGLWKKKVKLNGMEEREREREREREIEREIEREREINFNDGCLLSRSKRNNITRRL